MPHTPRRPGDSRAAFRAELAVNLAVASAAAALLAVGLRDEIAGGIHLVGAERVLRGELPYRDFWTLYAPGSFWLLAALFALLGTSLAVSAWAGVLLGAGAAGVLHRGARALRARTPEALAVAALFAGALWATGFHRALGTYPPAALAYALAFLAVAQGGERPGRLALLGGGAALGAAALFKHDVGAYAALACAAGIVAHGIARGTPLRALRRVALLAAAALAVFAPPVLWLVARGAGPDMFQSLIWFPATDFSAARPESYPPLLPSAALFDLSRAKRVLLFDAAEWFAFAAPPAVALAASARLLGGRAGADPAEGARRRAVAVRLGVAFLLHAYAARVQTNTHIVSMTFLSALLGAAALATLPARSRLRRLGLAFAAAWLGAWLAEPVLTPWLHQAPRTGHPLARAEGFRVHPDDAQHFERLRALVEEHVPPDAPLFVGEHRHDVVVVSDPRIYFLLERAPAVRYHELHPGIADREDVQREIVADLERHRPPLAILRHTFGDAHLDAFREHLREALPEAPLGSTRLDAYLERHYEPLERLGRLEIRRRKGGAGGDAAPADPPAAGAAPL